MGKLGKRRGYRDPYSHAEIQKAIARSRVKAFLAMWLEEIKDG